jgi:signal transduction histidine kinase
VLHDLGLLEAFEWLAEDCLGRHDLEVRIEDEAAPPVNDDRTRVLLFRAVREILVNARVHAGARSALLRLSRQASRLGITIEHAGVGYSAEVDGHVDDRLFGLREQLMHVNGSIHCESSVENGTKLELTAPLEAAQPAVP